MAGIAIFDVDGTLTIGRGVGTRCYFSAFVDVFSWPSPDATLANYRSSTDSGIALEIFERRVGRAPRADEVAALKRRYLELLDEALAAQPDAYRSVPGAHEVAERLRHQGWTVVLGTGNWREAAGRKLACAGLRALEGGFAEDSCERAAVVRAARERAARLHGERACRSVVYIGDQPWDVAAARHAGIGFVGIGSEEAEHRLREAGAQTVHRDFVDHDSFVASLLRAGAASA
jgi:phosphoglycolate phosphatase